MSQTNKKVFERNKFTLEGGQTIFNVHHINQCAGERCPIHNLSDHPMRSWRQHFRDDRQIMERICPHGIGHPDPDDVYNAHRGSDVHGCDGCCTGNGPEPIITDPRDGFPQGKLRRISNPI